MEIKYSILVDKFRKIAYNKNIEKYEYRTIKIGGYNMITKLRDRSQITLPNEVVKKLKLNSGDNLEVTVEEDKIVIKPVIIIDRSQAWFWSKEWQEKESEADKNIKKQKLQHAKDVDDLLRKLED